MRMTSFYVLYTAEYIACILIVLAAAPYAARFHKSDEISTRVGLKFYKNLPRGLLKKFDITLVYYFGLFASVPKFCSNLIYLHRKRD